MKDYESEMRHRRNDEWAKVIIIIIYKKQSQLDEEKRYIDYLERQKAIDRQMKIDEKLRMKDEQMSELDKLQRKKNVFSYF